MYTRMLPFSLAILVSTAILSEAALVRLVEQSNCANTQSAGNCGGNAAPFAASDSGGNDDDVLGVQLVHRSGPRAGGVSHGAVGSVLAWPKEMVGDLLRGVGGLLPRGNGGGAGGGGGGILISQPLLSVTPMGGSSGAGLLGGSSASSMAMPAIVVNTQGASGNSNAIRSVAPAVMTYGSNSSSGGGSGEGCASEGDGTSSPNPTYAPGSGGSSDSSETQAS